MNTQQKVKLILTHTGMDLFTLSGKSGVHRTALNNLMSTGETDNRTKNQINKLMMNYNLCPECGGQLIRSGGCVQCFCGWSMC